MAVTNKLNLAELANCRHRPCTNFHVFSLNQLLTESLSINIDGQCTCGSMCLYNVFIISKFPLKFGKNKENLINVDIFIPDFQTAIWRFTENFLRTWNYAHNSETKKYKTRKNSVRPRRRSMLIFRGCTNNIVRVRFV